MTERMIQISSPQHLVAMIESLVTGSFDKKFASKEVSVVVGAFAFVTNDLSQDQLNRGLMMVRDMGFCPDPSLFRRWCLGLAGFDNVDAIADSYIASCGALANITAWIDDNTSPISTAEKKAYDKTYQLWRDAQDRYSTNEARAAFKEHYERIVKGLVKQGISSTPYVAPVAIDNKQTVRVAQHNPVSDSRAKDILASLMAGVKTMAKEVA